jgi:hypothetical protein
MIYRRFGTLHARVLLQKQDILRELECELLTADKQDDKTTDGQLYLQSRDEEETRIQPARGCRLKKYILEDIERNLLAYGIFTVTIWFSTINFLQARSSTKRVSLFR